MGVPYVLYSVPSGPFLSVVTDDVARYVVEQLVLLW